MRTTHLHTTLICLLAGCLSVFATPKLKVVVLIDGLNQASLDMLRPYWSQGGLRTCSEEALHTTLSFSQWLYGGDESTATLLTGVSPLQHTYTMDYTFSRTDKKTHLILEDKTQEGIGTTLQISPKALSVPTLADQHRMRHGDKAKIYAIGIHPTTTILLAGHAANACCWIEADKLQWCSTSFYPEGLPSVADEMNVSGRFAALTTKQWTPRMDISAYTCPTDEEKQKGFSYASSKTLRQAPVSNTLVVELALAMQKTQNLGKDNTSDLLLLEMTTVSPNATSDKIQSAEQEDLYLCLNQDLGYLMEQLNRHVGQQNYDLIIVGKPVLGIGWKEREKANLTRHTLNVDRMAALTGTYLMALYGHERWIDGGYGQSIYLNRTLIEQKHLSLETLQKQVADFLMEFEGVQLAFPFRDALNQPSILPSVNKHCAGDVIFTLEEGWQLMANDWKPIDNVLDDATPMPMYYWSFNRTSWPLRPTSALELLNFMDY